MASDMTICQTIQMTYSMIVKDYNVHLSHSNLINLRQTQIPTRSLVCNKTGSEQTLLFVFTEHTS